MCARLIAGLHIMVLLICTVLVVTNLVKRGVVLLHLFVVAE